MNDHHKERRGSTGDACIRRDLAQRRQYAARRAVLALDRASRTASQASPDQWEHALRWMRVWIAFAASREVKGTFDSRSRGMRVA